MRHWLLIVAILAAILPAGGAAAQAVAKEVFSRYQAPAGSAAEPIGSYARGCLAGGVALSPTTDRWQSMRPHRNRNWGHPALIAFIERLSAVARAIGWPGIYVGDLSQPRGGPMNGGHRSHQIGLDADIWLRRPDRMDLTRAERERVSSHVVVAADGRTLNRFWTPGHFQLIKAAALDPAVARIFVNAVIKKALCEGEAATDRAGRAWLSKVRPWRGHNAHFHVRLACPDRSGICTGQPPPPPGDGCGPELERQIDEAAAQVAAAGTRSITDPDAALDEDEGYAEDDSTDERAGTRGIGRKVLTMDELPSACQALAEATGTQFAAVAPTAGLPAISVPAAPAPAAPVPVTEREVTALFGITGSRYLWVLPLDRDLASDPGLSFEATGALPPGLAAVPGQEGGLVIRGTPAQAGAFRFDVIGRHGGAVRARFAVAMAIEPGRAKNRILVPAPPAVTVPSTTVSPGTVSPGTVSPGTVSPAMVPSTTALPITAPSTREGAVRAFLRGFQGGDCFYAQPVRVADAAAEIEAFSESPTPVYALDGAFRAALGFEAAIGARMVGPGHCAALAFARQGAGRGGPAPRIAIDDVTVGAGGYLSGRVDIPAGLAATLLVVGPDGGVTVPASGLRGARQYSFRTRGPAGPRLLLAIASARSDPAGDAVAGGGDGSALFARLAAEVQAGRLAVALRYFTVE